MNKACKNRNQISDSLPLGLLLSVSGGLMDAYSYLCRGRVFANAQTGNILLISVNLARGEWLAALQYLCPVLSFSTGIMVAVLLRRHRGALGLHWRQVGVFVEMLLLLSVAFIPQSLNLLANSLISLACGFQVESFRKIEGSSIATTMCIGNLRAAVNSAAEYAHTHERGELRRAATYACVILAFAAGAVLGHFSIGLWGEYAILVSGAILLLCFLLMFIKPCAARRERDGNELL